MNRSRLNFLLLVIVLALSAGVFFAKRDKHQPKETLTPLAAEGVNKIVIEWPGSPTITLEKQAAEWLLTTPVKARADRFEAVGATSLASTEVQSDVDGAGLDLKELGLMPPDHSITLNGVKIDFGGSDALKGRRYVRVNGAVKLIDDPATAALDKDYADLVAKDLFGLSDELVQIELQGLTLIKAANGEWVAPAGTANATPAALKTLAEGWQSARAMWNEAAPGDAPQGQALHFTLKGGRVVDYWVVATDPQFALYSPTLKIRHQLSKALADTLLKLPTTPAATAAAPP